MESSITAPTLWALVEARAAATPDAVMLIDERDRTMTFAQYRDACEVAAAGFYADGVRKGDTISWQIPTWIETLVLMSALSRLGVRRQERRSAPERPAGSAQICPELRTSTSHS